LQAHILFVYGFNVADRPIADFSDAEFVATGHDTDIGSNLKNMSEIFRTCVRIFAAAFFVWIRSELCWR